jgi:acyl-CoA hydrolase
LISIIVELHENRLFMSLEPKNAGDSKVEMTELVLPNDTNPLGNLMGGNLMRWMDVAGSLAAAKHCEAHVVTASVDHLSFKRPIRLGNVIVIKACVTRAFNTSLEVFLEVLTGSPIQSARHVANRAYMTFVALDEDTQRPRPVPPVVAKTEEEKILYEGAIQRRELRLILAGKMKVEDASELKALFSATASQGRDQ